MGYLGEATACCPSAKPCLESTLDSTAGLIVDTINCLQRIIDKLAGASVEKPIGNAPVAQPTIMRNAGMNRDGVEMLLNNARQIEEILFG